jgi:hypothetical protein
LVDAGVGLPTLFGFAAIAAVIMGGLSFVLARQKPAATAAPSPRAQERQAVSPAQPIRALAHSPVESLMPVLTDLPF